jgi:aspartate/methionine/tyrosine aminotransferase
MFGALYVLVKTGGVESVKFSNDIINRYGVVTVPGKPFYGGSVEAVRVSLVATPWSEGDKLWGENVKALKKALG